MKLAEVSIALGGLPAFIMFALIDPHHVGLVLSKIEALSWMNLTPYRLMEVIVRDFPVFVIVKLVENLLELFFIQFEAPMLQIKLEFFRHNTSIFLLV